MARTIVVHRRGYWRGPYTYRRGGKLIRVRRHYVPPTTYRRTDVGAPGKGSKKIPIKEPGGTHQIRIQHPQVYEREEGGAAKSHREVWSHKGLEMSARTGSAP